jgi:hypothetical protein
MIFIDGPPWLFIFLSFPQIQIAGKETSRCRLLARKQNVDALTAQNRWAKGWTVEIFRVCLPAAFVG